MLRLYLKDIAKYPQLTPAEEHELAGARASRRSRCLAASG